MKVLVTGGCGFIGSALVEALLADNHDVHIIDNLSLGKDHWANPQVRARPNLHVLDILDYPKLDSVIGEVMPVVVFHMAAHHYIPLCEGNPFEAYRLNVSGTLNVLQACKNAKVKAMFLASTGDVYPPTYSPHREVDLVSPIYVYGHTKYMAEQMCVKFFETMMSGSSLMIGRIFNAAGPRETNPHFIPEVVKQIRKGKKVIEIGNTWPKRDFVDVDSMAQSIMQLTLRSTGIDIVNVGSGVVQEIGQVLDMLRVASGKEVEFVSVPERCRPNDRPYLCPDVNRITRLIGAAPRPLSLDTARRIFAE